MKIFLTFIGLVLFNLSQAQIEELKEASDKAKDKIGLPPVNYFPKTPYVNTFIGTGGHGHTYPGASAPFGMIQLSPDTRPDGWDGCSGYHYSDSVIYGFSHTHLSGTGVPDYCDLLIMPQVGRAYIDPLYASEKGFGSPFKHENENASPGFYEVHLDRGDIDVRLTVSERAGYHEYTFNEKSGKKFIVIDLDHRDKLLDSDIDLLDNQTIQGKRISQAWANEQHFYFHMMLSEPYQKARKFVKKGRNKLLLVFPKTTEKIEIRVGISAVDTEGAQKNVENEIPTWGFDKVKNVVNSIWNRELDKIEFISDNKEDVINFYTALYHSFLNPNLFSDVDKRYRGRDNNIHQLADSAGRNYTVFSLWDTYRAAHPLYTLTQVSRTNEFINTFVRQYDQGGDLPVWELAGNETECMIGYHSVSVIADAYMKGIREYDARKAISAMVNTTTLDEFGKSPYRKNGYIGTADEPESVSKTLEYAYDDFCIHQMLEELNLQSPSDSLEQLSKEYLNSSMNFVNVYDPANKFMRGRRAGLWFSPFDPAEVNFNYTEANSWQYSLYAPHAVGVLRDLLGGKDSLEVWLDRLFTTEMNLSGRHQVDITGLIGQYAHGNEPSHHMAYLYNYTNRPDKSQIYVDKIFKEMYSNNPDGLSGNEDCGQMSAWYVLSTLGIYQIAPGSPIYDFGRPLMNQAVINFENGKSLNVKTVKNSKNNKFVQKVILNGKELKNRYITHDELISGGTLVFEMGPKSSVNFNNYNEAPTISKVPSDFVPAPYFVNEERIFEDFVDIVLSNNEIVKTKIYYTTDGSEPDSHSDLYIEPFVINETTMIKAIAYHDTNASSVISNEFVKKDNNISIVLNSEYANQYASSGDFTLVDGISGGTEFRTGDWQGYWAQDVNFEVNFDQPIKATKIGIGALRDMKSWIFYPSEISIIATHEDGTKSNHWMKGEIATEEDMFAERKKFIFENLNGKSIKKLEYSLKTYGICPEWHLGNGNPTWTFLDEIIVE